MARGPKGPFSAIKSADKPAPRNMAFEGTLCTAIRNHVLVTLKHDDDVAGRTFAPYVINKTTKGKIVVFGMQIDNASIPSQRDNPHNFEIGKLRNVELTTVKFTVDPVFNIHDPRYRNRICPI